MDDVYGDDGGDPLYAERILRAWSGSCFTFDGTVYCFNQSQWDEKGRMGDYMCLSTDADGSYIRKMEVQVI